MKTIPLPPHKAPVTILWSTRTQTHIATNLQSNAS